MSNVNTGQLAKTVYGSILNAEGKIRQRPKTFLVWKRFQAKAERTGITPKLALNTL